MAKPIYSNRGFKFYKETTIPEGTECIIETWPGADYNKDTREYTSVPGTVDIKVYKKDPNKDYGKGDPILFFRQFENKEELKLTPDDPPVNLAAEKADMEKMDDDIPF
jgi:hypothetical protein